MERDGASRSDARARIKAQISIEERKKRADYVVDTTGSLAKTQDQVQQILRELERRVQGARPRELAGKESR